MAALAALDLPHLASWCDMRDTSSDWSPEGPHCEGLSFGSITPEERAETAAREWFEDPE